MQKPIVMRKSVKVANQYNWAEKVKYESYVRETECIYRFFSCFFDRWNLKSEKDSFSPYILHTLLFVLTKRDDRFFSEYEQIFYKDLVKYREFYNSKNKTLFQKGDIVGLRDEVNKAFEKKFDTNTSFFFELYTRTILCLYEYFDFADYLKDTRDGVYNNIFTDIYDICMLFSYIKSQRVDYEQDVKKEKLVSTHSLDVIEAFDKFEKECQDFDITPKSITFDCSMERKEEFCKIINRQIKVWQDKELWGLRNRKSAFDSEGLSLDWNLLFDTVIIKNKEFMEVSFEKGFTNKALQDYFNKKYATEFVSIDSFITNQIYAVCNHHFYIFRAEDCTFTCLIDKIQEENSIIQQEKDSKNEKEIFDLKTENRSLSKTVNKSDKEISKLKEEYEKLRIAFESVKQAEVDSEELKEAKQKLEDKDKGLFEAIETQKKLQNKNEWLEKKVEELSFKLERFSMLEEDLLTLQNENNVLSSQIEKLEQIEDEEDSEEELKRKLEAIKDKHIVFIGGVGGMMSKFEKIFPNSEYIDISEQGTSFTIPKSCDYVVIYTRVVTHAHCDRAEEQVGKEKILPINICNVKLVVSDLYNLIVGHKN